jgi:hypothetical protein
MRRLAMIDALSAGAVLVFIAALAITFGAVLTPPARAMDKSVRLGCCSCANGQIPNLTQAQCAQYADGIWDPSDPTCSG